MKKLLLFDVDGTLMEESPTHTESFNYACRKVYGVETDIYSFPRHGMTDTGILYGLLKRAGLDDAKISVHINDALKIMLEYVKNNIKPEDYKLLNGVNTALKEFYDLGYTLGLLTGNIQGVAELRAEKAGISKYFSTGGYGSDSMIRSELVLYALKRLGIKIDLMNVYLIGDTPLDIKAARDAGARAIAVATGIYKIDELKNADLSLNSLEEKNKIIEFLKNQ
ncbi:HAD family hydrolase [Acidiplasma aeolicum]|jgi:phosphoglycolate phosphatase-like HAD superfamily hydrolase|uniref:HAD family hydrolase n=1 Tax=Acidiplasma aeolicum TaxID=507754 RepID=UPI003716BDF1